MSFLADFADALNVAGVSSLVGERVYPGLAPQDAGRPYVIWRRNGGDAMATIAGTSTARARPQMLVIAAAETYDAAAAIGDAVRAALIAGSSNIKCNVVGLPVDGFDEGTRLFTTAIEALVFHKPT